ATSGQDALEEVARLRPDLVLMDVAMPGLNGLCATGRIKAQADAPRVVIVTLHDSLEDRAAALAAHADGFVAKAQFCQQLGPLISRLFAGVPTLQGSVQGSVEQGADGAAVVGAAVVEATTIEAT